MTLKEYTTQVKKSFSNLWKSRKNVKKTDLYNFQVKIHKNLTLKR